jgi:mannose-1-phosphate guanylyltransferase/mannose-1-phosphate guanylyltransferase/mannose-6-phosphate isomerase
MSKSAIYPVLLSGGAGSRLWPLSREAFPKQLLALNGPKTLLQQAAGRTNDATRFGPLTVIANVEHRFVIAEQLRALKVEKATIVLESEGRNTAFAAAVAALLTSRSDPDALILVMPADHIIGDTAAFLKAVEAGAEAARSGRLVLFGVQPTEAATGYGYIKRGQPYENFAGVSAVAQFVEKPNQALADEYLASNEYAWNSGIFLLHCTTFIAELKTHAPGVLNAAAQAVGDAVEDMDFLRLSPEGLAASPSISIDHAVMEKTALACVVAAEFPWTDVGSWSALWSLGDKDETGNVRVGEAFALESSNSYLRSEGPAIAAYGVEDLIIVATPDAVLVTPKKHDQHVKALVDLLRKEEIASATQTPRMYRPWGFYESIQNGDRFQVKRITVNPGGKLSLQKHFHRAEHWVVVNGTALVTRDGEEILLRENESIFLPLGCVHRLANPGKVPLNLIEVQSGPYLGEDDIVRIEDIYARV